MPAPTDTEPASWHRHFGSTANNRGWALAEQAVRTPEEDVEMRTCAHAAAWHWHAVGTELHRMRAAMLLAQVYALLREGVEAMRLASSMRDYFASKADTPDWELAFTHAIHANAAHAAGRADVHREAYAKAKAALEAIADDEDRAIVLKTFEQVPAP